MGWSSGHAVGRARGAWALVLSLRADARAKDCKAKCKEGVPCERWSMVGQADAPDRLQKATRRGGETQHHETTPKLRCNLLAKLRRLFGGEDVNAFGCFAPAGNSCKVRMRAAANLTRSLGSQRAPACRADCASLRAAQHGQLVRVTIYLGRRTAAHRD